MLGRYVLIVVRTCTRIRHLFVGPKSLGLLKMSPKKIERSNMTLNWKKVLGGSIIVSPLVIVVGMFSVDFGIVPVLMRLGLGIAIVGAVCLWFYGWALWDKG